jgi:beta-1,4-mannosyl-glycoprotein beta-1,4-N-acetylglucosaminyltransferase
MRVFDCFPLFNEVDLLELRLNELWDVVDFFVIVEARATFTGNPKPMCLDEHAERLAKYMDKIRYVVVDSFPDGMSNWGKEEYQRNALKEKLADVAPDDVLIFSDLDEIPRASVVKDILRRGIQPREVHCLSLDWYSFYLNIKIAEKWERQGPRLIRAGDLTELYALRRVMAPTRGFVRDLLRQIKSSWRMGHWIKRRLVPDAGWHFTWMGGKQAVALKGSSIPVHSDLPEGEKSLEWANVRMNALLKDGSRYAFVDIDESFPSYVKDNLDLFEKHIFKQAE